MSEVPPIAESDTGLVGRLLALADEWEKPAEGRHEHARLAFLCAAEELRAELDDHDAKPWRPSDGDTKCQRCHQRNGAWFAGNELWNAVMSDRVADWLAGEVLPAGDPGGCLCPRCFMLLAAERGADVVWRLLPEWSGRATLMDHPTRVLPPDVTNRSPENDVEGSTTWNRGSATPAHADTTSSTSPTGASASSTTTRPSTGPANASRLTVPTAPASGEPDDLTPGRSCRPCAGCDSIGESCRAVGCLATRVLPPDGGRT